MLRTSAICCIFWPALGCCALQTLAKILIFYVFHAKKQHICKKKLQKNIFLVWTKRLVEWRFCSNIDSKSSNNTYLNTLFCVSCHAFSSFFEFFGKKFWKSIFWPALGVCSTQMLVKIFNNQRILVHGFDHLSRPLAGLFKLFLKIKFTLKTVEINCI